MFKKIQLDHCYNEDKNFAFFKKLGKMGFRLDPYMVEHPGKAYCKFISLQSGNSRERFYLEFVHVGKGGFEERAPGLSFGYTEDLEKFFKKISKNIPSKYYHKNYEWKKNAIDRLPGWNMLDFKKQPIKNLTTWFTEYEYDPSRQKRYKKAKIHPNSVYGVHGFKLKLTKKSIENLEKILAKKLKAKTKLSDGTYLYIEESKKDKFGTIILKCKSLKKARPFLKKCEEVVFDKMPAIHIANNSRDKAVMWDLHIIEVK